MFSAEEAAAMAGSCDARELGELLIIDRISWGISSMLVIGLKWNCDSSILVSGANGGLAGTAIDSLLSDEERWRALGGSFLFLILCRSRELVLMLISLSKLPLLFTLDRPEVNGSAFV